MNTKMNTKMNVNNNQNLYTKLMCATLQNFPHLVFSKVIPKNLNELTKNKLINCWPNYILMKSFNK